MINERLEELAALHAMNLLDVAGERELLEAIRRDPEVADFVREFVESGALLACEAPEVAPPPRLKNDIMRQLPQPKAVGGIIHFPHWISYAIAACLLALGIIQTLQILDLKSQVKNLQSGLLAETTEAQQLRQSNALKDLRLAILQEGAAAQSDATYAASHVLVAWDPAQNRGVLSMHDLPTPPPGHDYQLWVLDPKAPAPISAGVISDSRAFAVKSVGTSNPGFAISLEPSGGRPTPTGPILFAAAPGQ
jgi:anti-sigma-K factor RskA